jgi:hypothetical protein
MGMGMEVFSVMYCPECCSDKVCEDCINDELNQLAEENHEVVIEFKRNISSGEDVIL